MSKILASIYLEIPQLGRLDKLSAKTGVAKSKYIREGIDLLLQRYEEQLKYRHIKRR